MQDITKLVNNGSRVYNKPNDVDSDKHQRGLKEDETENNIADSDRNLQAQTVINQLDNWSAKD